MSYYSDMLVCNYYFFSSISNAAFVSNDFTSVNDALCVEMMTSLLTMGLCFLGASCKPIYTYIYLCYVIIIPVMPINLLLLYKSIIYSGIIYSELRFDLFTKESGFTESSSACDW